MVSHDALLRLAFGGLNPETTERLLELGPEDAVDRMARSTRCSAATRREIAVSADVRREQLDSCGARFIVKGRPEYPVELASVPGAPPWLFVRGDLPMRQGVAIVGSRHATRYGLTSSERLARLVAEAGWTVVSGLAAGVDGSAHRGCLEGDGRTVAVLGSGIDVWYPVRHRRLGMEILESGGAVVSEFPPQTPPEGWRFPFRNRIISGLSGCVVVVEAAERSGALITARLALEQGKTVFAFPGDVGRQTSAGCNRLIRDGANPVVSLDEAVEDLEFALGPAPRCRIALPTLDESWMTSLPAPVEDVLVAMGGETADALARLAKLELGGSITLSGGWVQPR